jgi:hypothetical protein
VKPPRFRIGTLLLVVMNFALLAAVVVQGQRTARLESALADVQRRMTPPPPLPPLPPPPASRGVDLFQLDDSGTGEPFSFRAFGRTPGLMPPSTPPPPPARQPLQPAVTASPSAPTRPLTPELPRAVIDALDESPSDAVATRVPDRADAGSSREAVVSRPPRPPSLYLPAASP